MEMKITKGVTFSPDTLKQLSVPFIGVEEAMGVENSGVLYALWSYPAQAADELSFKEGDMVTILQKHEGSDWWWASLCGREGFVPNNYFGVSYQNNICTIQPVLKVESASYCVSFFFV